MSLTIRVAETEGFLGIAPQPLSLFIVASPGLGFRQLAVGEILATDPGYLVAGTQVEGSFRALLGTAKEGFEQRGQDLA
jgi:hypothetical protein